MRALSRVFAATALVLLLFVALSMVCSWRLWSSLVPPPAASASQQAGAGGSAGETETLREWNTISQGISLGLCGVLWLLGLGMGRRADLEAARRKQAELESEREKNAIDKHTQEQASKLRHDAEEQRRNDNLNRGQKPILEMLANPRPQRAEEILRQLVATLAAQQQDWDCSVQLVEQPGKTLRLAASSGVNETLRQYLARIGADFPDAPEGQAFCSGRRYVVEDMTQVQRPWSESLAANGIFAVWSVPFGSEGKVFGTLTVYSRRHSGPSAGDLEIAEEAAALAALIIEQRRIRDELIGNAYRDALTGVHNRLGGAQALEAALETAQQHREPLSVFWIDLVRFKHLNDQYGHAAGDEVLSAMARRLGSHPLVNGNLSRMGGDEFMALIPGTAAAGDPAGICRQLLEAIGAPIATSTGVLSVAGCIGVSCYPKDGVSSQSLERNADYAMHRGKSTGEGFCVFSPAMDEEVSQAMELEEALAVAVESKQLRLVYQPIYHSNGTLHGFEALLRFRNAKLGEISPARFIPKAEETGLIVPIGEWALRQACRQLHAWLAAGSAPVRMGVNVSAVQIARGDFAETVAGVLKECSVPPDLLTLELTETAFMKSPDAASAQMFLLKDLGIRIALDDFGTGYSSLSYLHKLPIDVVKIDRSFVERLAEAQGTRTIVEAIIALARHLGVHVVAEGVETEEQRRILEAAGCNGLQGYLFARPLPPEEAQNHLPAAAAVEDRDPVRVIRRVQVITA